MNIVIIGARESGAKNDPQALASALQHNGSDVSVVYWEDLVLSIATDDCTIAYGGRQLLAVKPDLVIAVGWYKSGAKSFYRDLAYATALYLDHHGVKFWNSEMLQQRSTSKLSCLLQLALAGVPVTRTTFSLSSQLTVATEMLPFVAKAASASRGRSNYLVASEQERAHRLDDGGAYLVQPFLENDHDLRVVCFGGVAQLVLRRSRAADATTHLNNTSQGGNAEWIPTQKVDTELLTICGKICKIMKREMAGIDLIQDASSPVGYSCLEVNAIPQLTSGYDTETKLAAFARAVEAATKESKT